MVTNTVQVPMQVYIHKETNNRSFLDMHYYLKAKGIQNNAFFLYLYDTDLIGVDPRDPNLPSSYKVKVLRECMFNYWYFLREVVRIPDQGGTVSSGKQYKLHRANLAMNYLFTGNFSQFIEMPRQFGKTIGAVVRYLYVFLFGTTNSEIMFIHKNHDGSKENLARLKLIREALPSYLRMDSIIGVDGKKLKVSNTVEVLQHPTNGNKIKTLPSAKNKQLANTLGRGCTQPLQYYDEFGWIVHNQLIYESATPAYDTASQNAKRNGAPFGILLTTTPGDMTTAEGQYAFQIRNNATPWDEAYYDKTYEELCAIKDANDSSIFFHIRYTYQQLGEGDEYLKRQVKQLNKNWTAIRREILLEWSNIADAAIFSKEDLDVIQQFCQQPIRTVLFGQFGQYQMQIYKEMDLRDGQIIGVDVAGGYRRDSSAITIINAKTTEVMAALNCNFMPVDDLANVVYQLVTKYLPQALVVIEKNGVGMGVVSRLMHTSIKKNLYYTIKTMELQERTNGVTTIRPSQLVKAYGLDNTGSTRARLIEILFQRVQYHKDKFISPILHEEMCGLIYKTTGGNSRVDHSATTHDDQIFSYLLALYVWYDCPDLTSRFGIIRGEIKTDNDIEEQMGTIEDIYGEGTYEILDLDQSDIDPDDPVLGNTAHIMQDIKKKQATFVTSAQMIDREYEHDQEALMRIVQSAPGRAAIEKAYHIDLSQPSIYGFNDYSGAGGVSIDDNSLFSFYAGDPEYGDDEEYNPYKVDQGNLHKDFMNIY